MAPSVTTDYSDDDQPDWDRAVTQAHDHQATTGRRWIDRIRRQLTDGLPPTDRLDG